MLTFWLFKKARIQTNSISVDWKNTRTDPSIIIGDFNSNAIWNPQHAKASHNDTTAYLLEYQIESLYHWRTGEEPGYEQKNTYSFWKRLDRCFHIDYCCASQSLIPQCSNFNLPDLADWLDKSDHVPIVIDFNER